MATICGLIVNVVVSLRSQMLDRPSSSSLRWPGMKSTQVKVCPLVA